MIAASEPHEYAPRGRQQVGRHPGPLDPIIKKEQSSDDFILNGIEKVCLEENNKNSEEWWVLRKAVSDFTQAATKPENNKKEANKRDNASNNFTNNKSRYTQCSDFLENSTSFKVLDSTTQNRSKRVSDSSPKFPNKRLSQGQSIEARNESAASCDTNKSYYAYAQNLEASKFSTKIDQEYVEDELYIKGHTVVWSRGIVNHTNNADNGYKVICCYTIPSPIKQALWCTFYCERPMYDETLSDFQGKVDEPNGTPVPSLCLVDSHNLRVFVTKGEQFVIPMSFPIERVWHTKFGIFIERSVESNFEDTSDQEPQPTLFSLAYPLDDICPVAVSQNNVITRMTNNRLKVVYTNDVPSICMLYDNTTKQHSIYYLRKIKFDEKDYGDKNQNSMQSVLSNSNKLKSRLSMWDSLMLHNHVITPTPAGNKPCSIDKLAHHLQKSRSYSSMAAMSRGQSPALSTVESPWIVHTTKKGTHRSFRPEKDTCISSKSFFDCSKSMSHLRSNPHICLEYIWTDTYSVQEAVSAGPASKVFLSEDLIGQWYLCYILTSRHQLSIVKIDFSCPSNITFGVLTSISAKDAAPIPHLKMLAILEHNGNVTLYSGLTVVGKLHVGGTLAQHTPSPFIRKNIFASPFPRRSSLLPQYKQAEPKFEEHLLSPVLPSPIVPNVSAKTPLQMRRLPDYSPFSIGDDTKTVLTSLIDPIDNRITLKYSDGSFYRISLPILASSNLVESCVVALRQCLPRDTAITVMSRWYATRNVLGAQDISASEEWDMFTGLLLELLGYEDDHAFEMPETPYNAVKRLKQSLNGTDEDWTFMISSERKTIVDDLARVLHLDLTRNTPKPNSSGSRKIEINPKSILFPYIKLIHFTLHLFYEDLKLNTLRLEDLLPLMKFLNRLSNDLNLPEYSVHYWKDFPQHAVVKSSVILPENVLKQTNVWPGITSKPVNVMQHIYELLDGKMVQPYPYLGKVNTRSRNIVQLCGVLSESNRNIPSEVLLDSFVTDLCNPCDPLSQTHNTHNKSVTIDGSTLEQVVLLMVDMKIDIRYIETLPMGVYFLLYNALWKCREKPPSDWPIEAYHLLWRDDLVAQAQKIEMEKDKFFQEKMNICFQLQESMPNTKQEILDLDGMEDIDSSLTKMLFREDVRVLEAKKMLGSSKPVPITVTQRPDVSDHDFIEEQEKHLYGLCIRSMALPVGRGMFTLRTATPIITEPLAAPVLCLTGKAPPRGTTVELNHIDTPANMNLWPLFHNGVANGLRITPDAQNIDNTWIIFNKPKGGVEPQMEHAGFLMALGLNGHLKNLAIMNTFEYLGKLHEMTSVGILLGLSAAFRGTTNQSLTKMLAIHVEALLPPTSMEIDVPQNLQVAGLIGIGLVYQRSAHRHITEVLLSEIGRPPGPEMENSVDRESYSLAAGLALGLVMLKHGGQPAGMSDLNVPDTLHYYMVGGTKRSLTGSQKDKYKTPSFQIREGSSVNLDITAPGATLALGMIYLGTGNKAVADWMAPPATQYLLDFVRPDFLMLRVLSRSLILWNEIEPSKKWVVSQVPTTILPYCMVTPSNELDVDYEAMNQAYCNIVTGACFALGLKFAGTADQDAFETLLFFCHMFTSLTGKSIAELAGKATIETCLNVLLLSAAMVTAGTGNLEVMRLVRHLRRRVGLVNSAIVTYGSHLAIHMALGLLFLGGGRYTLSNSPESVAALICAFYPKFPTHSNDNRYHLQAFRHLYVLAVEPRLVIPKDVHSDEICYAHLRVVKLDGAEIEVKAPGLIPDLNTLIKVVVDDERYWPVVFERGRNWELLVKILSTTGYIEVKQRAGCLSYVLDKFGYHSQLARTLTQSKVVPWDPSASFIVSFTSDECIRKFCDYILTLDKRKSGQLENRLTQMLTQVTYDAVVKDKLVVIVALISLIKSILDMDSYPNTFHIWQLKLVMKQVLSSSHLPNLISKETMLSLIQEVTYIFDKWEDKLKNVLQKYVVGECFDSIQDCLGEILAPYVVFYDIPYNCNIKHGDLLETIVKLENVDSMSSETIAKIIKSCE